jgi:hypothetical protein
VWIIDICERMIAVHHDLDEVCDRDPHAPDSGPEHWWHEALLAEQAALAAALTKAAPPATPRGVRMLAELALVFAPRLRDGTLAPESFGDWLRLFALVSAAGKPELLRLPIYLPDHWPDGLTTDDPP